MDALIIILVSLALTAIAIEFYHSAKKSQLIDALKKENEAYKQHLENYKQFIIENGGTNKTML